MKTAEQLVVDSRSAKHLRTDHLLHNLERHAISSGMISFFSQCAQFVLNLASILILVRILDPADFGLVAMVTTVMGFLRVFREVGLSTATIQREGITPAQVSNLFWINVSISCAVGVIFAVASPVVAWFYREPRLIPVTLLLAVTFPLSGLTVQHTALLSRQMRFKALALVQVGSQSLGFATGIAMAWLGYRYWALVGMTLVTAGVTAILTYIAVPWKPQAPARQSGTRPLFHFGANLAAGGFVFSIARGADGLAIGRVFGTEAIGIYSRAGALLNRPLEQVLNAAESVLVPMLSRVQNQPDRYRSTFLNFFQAINLIGCVVCGVLLVLSRPVTLIVLGRKWEQAAIVFAGFCLSAMCGPMVTGATWLLSSQGRGKEMLRATLLISGMLLGSVLLGLPFGPAGVAFAASVLGVLVVVPVTYHLAGRNGPVTTADLWLVLWRCLPLWAVVCGATSLMYFASAGLAPIMQIIICAPVGLAAGVLFIWSSAPLRKTALGLINIRRELLFRECEPPSN